MPKPFFDLDRLNLDRLNLGIGNGGVSFGTGDRDSRGTTHSAPILIEPMAFTIYLGQISENQAQKIVQQLRTQGLLVVTRPEHKYLVSDGSEWVVPLEYLPPPPKNYPPLKIPS